LAADNGVSSRARDIVLERMAEHERAAAGVALATLRQRLAGGASSPAPATPAPAPAPAATAKPRN